MSGDDRGKEVSVRAPTMIRPKMLVILNPNESGRVMAPDEITTNRGTLSGDDRGRKSEWG